MQYKTVVYNVHHRTCAYNYTRIYIYIYMRIVCMYKLYMHNIMRMCTYVCIYSGALGCVNIVSQELQVKL